MTAFELKTDLHHLIDEVKDTMVLKAIHTILKNRTENGIVGFTVNGKPITKKAFIKRIEKAEEQIKKGQYITAAQLEKEAENW